MRAGDTALMGASAGDYLDVVQALIAAGADVNIRDADGMTALTAALKHLDVQSALLRAGAKP